jgi:hypothetical protein
MRKQFIAAATVAALLAGSSMAVASIPPPDPQPAPTAATANDASGGYEGIIHGSTADPATVNAVQGDSKDDIPTVVVVKSPAAKPAPAAEVTSTDNDGWKIATFALGATLVGLLGCVGVFMMRMRRPEPVLVEEPEKALA